MIKSRGESTTDQMAFERFMRTMSPRFDYIVGAIEEESMEGWKTTFVQAQHSKKSGFAKWKNNTKKGKELSHEGNKGKNSKDKDYG